MTTYYKAVDEEGLSYFPVTRSKRLNWIELIDQGGTFTLGDEKGFEAAVAKLRKGDTVACSSHLIHGYADIRLAIDFGQRYATARNDDRGFVTGFRLVSFEGDPVAELTGTMLFNTLPWDKATKEEFHDATKYGFRSVHSIVEVDELAVPLFAPAEPKGSL